MNLMHGFSKAYRMDFDKSCEVKSVFLQPSKGVFSGHLQTELNPTSLVH